MKLKEKPFLLKVITSLFFLFLFSTCLTSQNSFYKLISQELSVEEILQKWSQLSNKTLNYSTDDLPTEKYTFSMEGSYQSISEQLYPYLGLKAKQLQETTIVTVADSRNVIIPSISIKVVDEDLQALPFAYASNPTLDIVKVASAEGLVKIDVLMAPSDTLTFNYLGYEESYFTLRQIRSNRFMVQLQPSSESLSEILVIGSPLTATALEKIDPTSIPQAGTVDQDVITVTQNLPGITNPSESFQDLIIRGGSPDQVQYQWNGIRILQSSHFFGKISSLNPYMIDKVEISKDGYSASNGGTVSGGLHMKSKNRVDSLSGSFHLNMLYGNVGLSVPLTSTFSAKIAVRQSLPQSLLSPLATAFQRQIFQFGKIPDEDVLIRNFELEELVQTGTEIDFGDRQLSLWYQATPRLTFNADFIYMENRLRFRTDSDELDIGTLDELFQSNRGFNISAHHYWNSSLASSLEYSQSEYQYKYEETPETTSSEIIGEEHSNDIRIFNLRFKNKLQVKWVNATFGYERNGVDAGVVFANRLNNTEDLYSNNGYEDVGFITLHPEVISNLHMDLGVRYSAYNKSLNNRKLIEPRLHLKYRFNNKVQLHGHYGRYHQYLTRRNFFTPFQADNGFWYIADESATEFLDFINIIESQQYGGGIDLSRGPFDISLDIFQKSINNIYSSSFDLSVDENPFNVGNVEIAGAELMVRFEQKHHKVMSTYEYNDERIMFNMLERPSLNPFSQPHRFNFAYEFSWKLLSSTLQYNFAVGRPFTVATEILDENNTVDLLFDELLTERVPNYHRVDLSLRTRPIGKRLKFSFGGQVNNLLNRTNIIKNQYFINLLADPLELGLLEKQGIPRSYNVFMQLDF